MRGGRCALWGDALFSRLFQNAVSGASESVWCRACWAFRKIGESSPWTGEMVWGEREGGLGKKRSALHRPPQCAASVCAARCICHRTAVYIPVQCRTSGMGVAVKMKWGVLLAPQGRGFSPVQPCSGIQDSLLMIKAKHSSCPHVTHPQMWRCTVGNPGIGIPDESEAKWWGLMRA